MFVDGVWWMCVCDVLFEFVWMYFVYFNLCGGIDICGDM